MTFASPGLGLQLNTQTNEIELVDALVCPGSASAITGPVAQSPGAFAAERIPIEPLEPPHASPAAQITPALRAVASMKPRLRAELERRIHWSGIPPNLADLRELPRRTRRVATAALAHAKWQKTWTLREFCEEAACYMGADSPVPTNAALSLRPIKRANHIARLTDCLISSTVIAQGACARDPPQNASDGMIQWVRGGPDAATYL